MLKGERPFLIFHYSTMEDSTADVGGSSDLLEDVAKRRIEGEFVCARRRERHKRALMP